MLFFDQGERSGPSVLQLLVKFATFDGRYRGVVVGVVRKNYPDDYHLVSEINWNPFNDLFILNNQLACFWIIFIKG